MPPLKGRSAIENEAGQRVGAVNGTRLRSQRPAEPTVTDFSGVLDISNLRCRVCPLPCVDGAVQTRPSYPLSSERKTQSGRWDRKLFILAGHCLDIMVMFRADERRKSCVY